VTPKERVADHCLRYVIPHLVLLAAMAAGIAVGAARVVATPSTAAAFAANLFWTLHNASCLAPIVLAAAASGPRPGAR
jgi:hypothetical protein